MNRRKALMLSLLSGGLFPSALKAQDRPRRDDPGVFDDVPSRRGSDRFSDVDLGDPPAGLRDRESGEAVVPDQPPANFRDESGHAWRTFDIARYVRTAYTESNPNPEAEIVKWIFRRTGSAIWHGEKIAVLSAGRAQLRAYHNPKVLKQVEEMVERFTDAQANVLSVRVRFVSAQDPRWRYAVFGRLNRVATGPHGQQVWSISREDASLVYTQLTVYPSFKLLANETVRLVNGQTLTVDTREEARYFSGTQRESAVGQGYQPSVQNLKEGVLLRLSPLLNFEGDLLDAAIDLEATTVRRLYRTKILTRRELGSNEVAIDVPEVTETRLNQVVDRWEVGQTLLISAGIAPGILQSKNGILRLPFTTPNDTELLVFIDVEPAREAPRAARSRDDVDDRRE
jgi:hypothetical protein